MIDPITIVLGAGDAVLAVIAGLAIRSSSRWQDRAVDAETDLGDARSLAETWRQIAKDHGSDNERLAGENRNLRRKISALQADASAEPKLIRIPKGQPGAGRFVPNPKWKAELTA